MAPSWVLVMYVLLGILFATLAILYAIARRVGIDAITGSMRHIGHNNLMQLRIFRGVRDFCTNHAIYFIRSDPMIS